MLAFKDIRCVILRYGSLLIVLLTGILQHANQKRTDIHASYNFSNIKWDQLKHYQSYNQSIIIWHACMIPKYPNPYHKKWIAVDPPR